MSPRWTSSSVGAADPVLAEAQTPDEGRWTVPDEQLSNRTQSRRAFLVRTAALAGGATAATPLLGDRALGAIRRKDRTLASTKTVQMWSQAYGDPKAFNDFIGQTTAAFKKKTGITVKWDVVQWASALQKWDLAMSKGEVPDVADMFFLLV